MAKGGKTAASVKKGSSSGGSLEYNPKKNLVEIIPGVVGPVLLPTLPTPGTPLNTNYAGPTDYSNWLIPHHICVGGYPRSKEVDSIVSSGVTTFVNLVEEDEQLRCGPFYFANALKKTTRSKLNYVTFPIRDKNIAEDDKVTELVTLLAQLVNRGEVLYVHCVG